jgi:sterol desaturase/sphingolipid hydroxylase (fatty acid hydroxylase superfamily)
MEYTIIPKDSPNLAPHYHGPESDDPVYRSTIARMFRSDFLEFFSKVHPLVPAALYVPMVVWMTMLSSQSLAMPYVAVGVAGGLLLWTFAEYILHRYIFHIPLNGTVSKFLYFQSHGIHHQYPDDYYRLVMVPPVSVPLAALFWGLFSSLLPMGWATSAFAGFVIGYLVYDYTHFAVHILKPPRAAWLAPVATWFKAARRRHLVHHFKSHNHGFGVSTELWDHVFNTVAKD